MTTQSIPDTDDDAGITRFVHRWAEAIVTNDVAQMEPFTTDDWVLIDQPGVITRDAFHGVVASGRLRHDSMAHDVLDIRRLGPVAVVSTHASTTGAYDGAALDLDEWTTDVLVRSGGGWRCLLTQLTPRKAQP